MLDKIIFLYHETLGNSPSSLSSSGPNFFGVFAFIFVLILILVGILYSAKKGSENIGKKK